MRLFSDIKSFAMSIASRVFKGTRAPTEVKKLRVISCFGNDKIPACPNLQKEGNSYFCGGCQCPKVEYNALIREDNKYSKLDYPYLECPLKNPGFNNYEPSFPNEHRKVLIENISKEDLDKVQISEPPAFEGAEEFFDKITKLQKGQT